MRYDLLDKTGKLYDSVDSDQNPEIKNVKVLILDTPLGERYFQYVGMVNHHEKCQDCVPAFQECDGLYLIAEIKRDSNDRANAEIAD